jgi:protein gp37
MAQNSSIEWTDHTFNPWWGCSKVSPACLHCYAETWAKRVGQKIWGVQSPRRLLERLIGMNQFVGMQKLKHLEFDDASFALRWQMYLNRVPN